ncbi:hypothetical protein FACS189423_06760 [Bacteroidia bacterium]|nr:hypothetical protein FACS189423_06760 [Bacteroidia bacterium]
MNKYELEKKAGQIWFLISLRGTMSLKQICGITHEKHLFIILALGLLIEEDKVSIYEKGNDIIVESAYSFLNMYY